MYALAASNERDARSFIVAVMVLIWAVRLGSFLFIRAKQTGGDSRFDSVKHRFIPFLVVVTPRAMGFDEPCWRTQ